MASRMKISTVLKMVVICFLFIGVVSLGVAASNEVIQAALSESHNGGQSGSNNINDDDGGSVRMSGRSGGKHRAKSAHISSPQGMMSPMMMSSDAMYDMEGEAEEITLSATAAAPPMHAKMRSMPAASGGSGGFNGRNNDPAIEKLIRQEGGYDPQMGQDVMNTGRTNQFDPMKVDPMLVRTGNIQATTAAQDFDTLQSKLVATVLEVPGAYVESSNNYGGWKDQHDKLQGRSINIQARVPVDMFFKLRDAIVNVFEKGEVGSMSDSVSDVTSQYVDAAARAETLKATQAQLQKLMSYAQTVDAVIKVQRELTSVTQQLEAKEAIMQRLSKQSSLSTLSINVNQKQPPPPKPDKPNKKKWSISRSLKRANKWLRIKLQNTVDVIIFATFALVPTLLGFYLLALIMRVTNTARFITIFMNWVSNSIYSFYISCFTHSSTNGGNSAPLYTSVSGDHSSSSSDYQTQSSK